MTFISFLYTKVLRWTQRDQSVSLEDFLWNFQPTEDKDKKTAWFKVIKEVQQGKELKNLDITALNAVRI